MERVYTQFQNRLASLFSSRASRWRARFRHYTARALRCFAVFAFILSNFWGVAAAAADDSTTITLDTSSFQGADVIFGPLIMSYSVHEEYVAEEAPYDRLSFYSTSVSSFSSDFYGKVVTDSAISFYNAVDEQFYARPAQSVTSGSFYKTYTSVPSITFGSQQFRISTGVYLDPGIYEISFGAVFTRRLSSSGKGYSLSNYQRASTYSYFFRDAGGTAVVPFYSSDRTKVFIELAERSQLIVSVSFSSVDIENERTTSSASRPYIDIYMYNPNLTYTSLPDWEGALEDVTGETSDGLPGHKNDLDSAASSSSGLNSETVLAFGSAWSLISGFDLALTFLGIWLGAGIFVIICKKGLS